MVGGHMLKPGVPGRLFSFHGGLNPASIGFGLPPNSKRDWKCPAAQPMRPATTPLNARSAALRKAAARELRTGSLAPAYVPTRSIEQEIGTEVRRLRKSLDLTVTELGAAAGISAGMLSKIENGTISPSLSTLSALAHALNVSISGLFAETDERRDCSFVRAGSGVRIERRGTKAGHLYDLLGHSLAGEIGVEPYLITLKTDAQPYTNFRHAGVEFIYMLTGKVRYRHADRTYLLEPGDALFFDCRRAAWAGRADQGADDLSVDHHLPAAVVVLRPPC